MSAANLDAADVAMLETVGATIGKAIAAEIAKTQPSRRERIATALFAAVGVHSPDEAVRLADKLMAKLEGTDPFDVLASVLPYAESRAEDMNASADACSEKAWKAVEDAKALLRAVGRLP